MNIYRPLIFSLISVISLTIYATEQTPDVLIYKSDTIYLETYPFEILMDSDSLIRQRIFGDGDDFCISSGCWRGHVATWIIENDSLFLTRLIDGCKEFEFSLDEIFQVDKVIDNKVFAYWFTGDLLEYQSWFILLDEESGKEAERFSQKIVNGKVNYCEYASALAQKDFEKSNYSLHSVRFFPTENAYFDVLRMDYNINWIFTDSTDFYECYDSVMRKYLIEKHGEDIFKKAGFRADSLRKSGKWRSGAEFPGGQSEMFKFISNKLKQESIYVEGIKTRFIVEIEIDTNGNVTNPIVLRGLDNELDNKVLEILKQMPSWKPAYFYGEPIKQTFTIPINVDYE